MKDAINNLLIVCSLSSTDLRSREQELLGQFKEAVMATEEIPDGYVFRLPGDRKWIALSAELMAAERECCPFLSFELVAQPNMGPLALRMTGPDGAKDFVKNHFVP